MPTLIDRLRAGADNIHSIGPARAADLLSEAALRLEQDALAENCIAFPVTKELRAAQAERRAFLERAVCHPGPPASEHEGYDPEAALGELEAAVLERMDLELQHERDLREIRRVLEEAIGRTPDPARSALQVARDAAAHLSAARTYRANMEDPPAGLEPHETSTRREGHLLPVVRPEHFAGPFPAISGYVKRTREARAAVVDQALGMLGDGQRLAVHDEAERVDILFLGPGQDPPRGQTWAVYGPLSAKYREALKASLDRERRARAGGRPASTTGSETHQDAIAAHIKAHGGDPASATVAQIADAMNAVDPNATYKPNAEGNGLDWS